MWYNINNKKEEYVMSDKIKIIIDDVNATMRLEGMPLTTSDKDMLRRCLNGDTTFEEERQRIFNEIRNENG